MKNFVHESNGRKCFRSCCTTQQTRLHKTSPTYDDLKVSFAICKKEKKPNTREQMGGHQRAFFSMLQQPKGKRIHLHKICSRSKKEKAENGIADPTRAFFAKKKTIIVRKTCGGFFAADLIHTRRRTRKKGITLRITRAFFLLPFFTIENPPTRNHPGVNNLRRENLSLLFPFRSFFFQFVAGLS